MERSRVYRAAQSAADELTVEMIIMLETEDRMLQWFKYAHLPEHLQEISRPFHELATRIVETVPAGPERTVALRKLLEAKDAGVRAVVCPGG